MKTFLLLSLALPGLSFTSSPHFSIKYCLSLKNDSNIIVHKLDGAVDEWPADKFSSDNETGIQYAIDNDAKNLFIALNIPNFKAQVKMMRMGMSMYIDLKGKKKESHGIEFPVKNGNADINSRSFSGAGTNRQNDGQQTNEQQRKQDIRVKRKMMALNLVELKIFGLSDKYPDGQQLLLPGSANIAFSWDSTDIMHIEYLIPVSMIGDIPSLNQKNISIGWKIHAYEMPNQTGSSENPSTENRPSGRGGGFSGGGRRPGNYGGRGNNTYSGSDKGTVIGEQKFWTKYTINIPAEKKAF